MNHGQAVITDVPLVSFGRPGCGDLNTALRREWLVTNGLGGFASGTVAGAHTRRYHALFVTADNPPGDRFVLAGGLVEEVQYNGGRWPPSSPVCVGGIPSGHKDLGAFMVSARTGPRWSVRSRPCVRPITRRNACSGLCPAWLR